MTSLKLKNKHLIGLGSWLNELQLEGRESRERTRFVNQLVEKITENEKFRNEMIEKYAKKDKDGQKKKKTLDDGTEVWDVPADKMEEYSKEYANLMDEDFVLDVLDGNKQRIKVVREIVLNTPYKFGPKEEDAPQEKLAKIRQAADYGVWCDAFEAVELKD